MEYRSIIDFYNSNSLVFIDEAGRIADDCYTYKIQLVREKNSKLDLPDKLKDHICHFLRSIRRELFAVRLHFLIAQHNFADPLWWGKIEPFTPKEVIMHMLESYEMNTKRGFILGVFSTMEHCFRYFMRQTGYEIGNVNNFWRIRDTILTWDKKLEQYRSMLGLFANIRNEIHNDGIFYSTKGENIRIEYKGQCYEFIHGKATDFVTWELLFSITEDLPDLIYILGTSEYVQKGYCTK